ncbi:MAG TPA: LPS assembly lipoprotein LptE [Gammaproteobacteria bacterium]|jgi:LPS-assembly lipoprotein|nr:LPS assembly lipoprotein LptE [Gammaproteobacteria bacterium]
MKIFFNLGCLFIAMLLTSCGFHLQGSMPLAPPLQQLYIQAPDPYGIFVRTIQQYCKMSKVQLVKTPAEASTVLVILQDDATEQFLSVSGTQQTRQYKLIVTVSFMINNAQGKTLVPPQTLSEERTITIQSNQILGSSNEASLFYQQMRRSLAYAVMNRIASKEVSQLVIAQEKP